jgi:hypothetical protein
LVSDGRLAGLIDWDIIKDRGREMVHQAHWASPAEIIRACAEQFRVDHWAHQPWYVEVMVEKQALEGVLIPVCHQWDVPFTANKGYSSSSAMREAGQRIYDRLRDGKEIVVIYLGDHDPSGIDMTRDIEERLRLFAECQPEDTVQVEVIRVALNMDQIEDLQPPENPAKITDSRAASYIERFGESSWELDAVEPRQLVELVSDCIRRHVDMKQWKQSEEEQRAGRRYLKQMADNYKPGKKQKRKTR